MTQYLQKRHPHASPDEITAFVQKIVKDTCKVPETEAVVHKYEGHSDKITVSLASYTQKTIGENNLLPSGTCYLPVSKKESFLRISIEDKIKERNDYKKKYLAAEAEGKVQESQYYNQNQANAKIFNNAIAGGMRLDQFILSCRAGFNAITSMGRLSVKQAYSFIERAVNGNLYLPTVDSALTYVLNHIQTIPTDFGPMLTDHHLYQPTIQDVLDYLRSSLGNYCFRADYSPLESLLCTLTDIELAYVFYAGCLSNLCRFNNDLMRRWIDSCFIRGPIERSLWQDIDTKEVKSFRSDVEACVLSTNYTRLGLKKGTTDKWNSIKNAAEDNPDGLREFIYCCRHFVTHFEQMVGVLQPIFQVNTTFAQLLFHDKMARQTVPLSDTDSNIFSTQEMIRWKCGKIDFSQEAYEMNAMVTFILSQSLEHVFARLSAGFGAEGKDVFRISMKNEFLYPVLIATALGKHYLAIATMQEGSLLPKLRKDIRGIGFRSSVYPRAIRDDFEKYVVDLFTEIQKGEPIRAASVLKHVADVEQTIYKSISNRDSDYLQTVSIKRKEEYADAATSVYHYYELWQAVFADTYGEMVIPNKCFKIPLKDGNRLFKDAAFLERLEKDHPDIHKKWIAFKDRPGNRDISAVMVPPFKGKIHPFFVEIMDVRAHVCSVMAGYYHMLDALGIGNVDIRCNGLVSDFYDPSTFLIE
jgi:hypothetical protein